MPGQPSQRARHRGRGSLAHEARGDEQLEEQQVEAVTQHGAGEDEGNQFAQWDLLGSGFTMKGVWA